MEFFFVWHKNGFENNEKAQYDDGSCLSTALTASLMVHYSDSKDISV